MCENKRWLISYFDGNLLCTYSIITNMKPVDWLIRNHGERISIVWDTEISLSEAAQLKSNYIAEDIRYDFMDL